MEFYWNIKIKQTIHKTGTQNRKKPHKYTLTNCCMMRNREKVVKSVQITLLEKEKWAACSDTIVSFRFVFQLSDYMESETQKCMCNKMVLNIKMTT